MRLLILIILTFFLASCLEDALAEQNGSVVKGSSLSIDDVLFDQSAEALGSLWLLRSGQDFLSEKAQANLKEFMAKRIAIRKQMMNICGLKPALSEDDKEAIARIKGDKNLENNDKKSRIKALLNERMKERSQAINGCRRDKKVLLEPYVNQRNILKAACLISFKPDEEIAGHPTKKARAWQRIKTLTNEEKFALNKQLESTTCMDVLILPSV